MARRRILPAHMSRDGDRFVARVSVPVKLRPIIGQSELTRTLGPDRREAMRLLPMVVGEFKTRIANARDGVEPTKSETLVVRRLSPTQMGQRLYDEQTEQDDRRRLRGPVNVDFGLFEKEYSRCLREVVSGAASNDEINAVIGWAIDDFRRRGHHDAVTGSPEWRLIARALATAEAEYVTRQSERDGGDWDGEPKAKFLRQEPKPEPAREYGTKGSVRAPVNPVSLSKLFKEYQSELLASEKGKSLQSRWLPSINRFIDFVGHDDVTRMTKSDFIRWKDELVSKGAALKTVRDVHLAALKATLRWGVENDRLDVNPAESVKVRVPAKRRVREQGFTDDEAKVILTAARDYQPIDYGHAKLTERPRTTAAKRWVPWLCAHTGARVGEMVQLRKEDVREKDGIHYLRLTSEAGTIKSGNYRDVPIHGQLIERGFLAFVEAASDGPLFFEQSTTRDIDVVRIQVVGVLAKWVRSLGVDDKGVAPNHGWRHRFKTVSRELGIDPRVVDAIQGHSGRTSGENYGDVTMKARKSMIDRMPCYDVK